MWQGWNVWVLTLTFIIHRTYCVVSTSALYLHYVGGKFIRKPHYLCQMWGRMRRKIHILLKKAPWKTAQMAQMTMQCFTSKRLCIQIRMWIQPDHIIEDVVTGTKAIHSKRLSMRGERDMWMMEWCCTLATVRPNGWPRGWCRLPVVTVCLWWYTDQVYMYFYTTQSCNFCHCIIHIFWKCATYTICSCKSYCISVVTKEIVYRIWKYLTIIKV